MTCQTGPRQVCVVLVGPPGAGKSTIGRKLARELGAELVDTDAVIEAETGRTIPEIFAADGEPEFRRLEQDVVHRAVVADYGIISLGGGAVLSAATRELLRERTVVYLEISVAEGLRRTGAATHRPLLTGADPAAKYRELMRIRRPLYREVASVRVRSDGRSPGRVVRNILARLGLEPAEPNPVAAPARAAAAPGSAASRRSRRRRRGGRGGANKAAAQAKPATTPETRGATTADTRPAAEPATQRPDSVAEPTPRHRSRRGGRRRSKNPNGTITASTEPTPDPPAATSREPGPAPRRAAGPRRSRAARRPAGPPTPSPNSGAGASDSPGTPGGATEPGTPRSDPNFTGEHQDSGDSTRSGPSRARRARIPRAQRESEQTA